MAFERTGEPPTQPQETIPPSPGHIKNGAEAGTPSNPPIIISRGLRAFLRRHVEANYPRALKEAYQKVGERAEELGQKKEKLAQANTEFKLLDYEVKARANPQEFRAKDESPVSADELSMLGKISEKQIKYAGDRKITNPSNPEQGLQAIKLLDKTALSKEDLATVTSLEYRLKTNLKKQSFDDAATVMLRDKERVYTPDEMRIFLTTPKGETMHPEKALEALKIVKDIRERGKISPEEDRSITKAEKMIRQLGNLPKGNKRENAPAGPRDFSQEGNPLVLTNEELGPLDSNIEEEDTPAESEQAVSAQAPDVSPELPPDYTEFIQLQAIFNKYRATNKRRYHRLPQIERFHEKNALRNMLDGIQELKKGRDMSPEDRRQVIQTEQNIKYEMKKSLFEGIANLIRQDTTQAYNVEHTELFDLPPRGDVLSKEVAEHGIAVLDKLRQRPVMPIRVKNLISATEELIRTQANLPRKKAVKVVKKRR